MVARLMTEDELDFNADSLFNPMAFPINVGTVADQGNTQPQVTAGLSSNQTAQVNPQPSASRLDLQSLITPEDAANIRMASDIGASYPIVRGNEVYSFNPDGSIEYTRMNPGGIGATLGLYSSTGEEIVPQYYNADFGKTSTATRLLQAGLAAGIGGILGPAGAGLLSAPVAAATGAGLTSYGVTGDLESALKAAALGGLTAYGTQALFGGTGADIGAQDALDLTLADDIQNLSNLGLSQNQISQVISSGYGIDPFAAAEAVSSTLGSAAVSPSTVTVTGSGLGGLSNIASALSSVLPAAVTPGATQQVQVQAPSATQGITADTASTVLSSLVGQPVSVAGATQQVQVTGQAPAQQVAPEVAAALISAATGQQVTVEGQTISPQTTPETVGAATGDLLSNVVQTVPVTGQTMATTPSVPETVGSVIGSLAPTQTVPVTSSPLAPTPEAPSVIGSVVGSMIPTTVSQPTQQVTVESKPVVEDEFTPLLTPPPVLPPKFEVPIPEVKVAEPTKPLVSTNDLLKLLTLLGTGTAGTGMMGGGTNIGSIPPSDTMLGSTTPQFGPDYYAAVQQYYNAYMPETPRNVAGPLQQWYENKYGA